MSVTNSPLTRSAIARSAAITAALYIRHLQKADEMLGMRLAVMHNLYFYNHLMERIREALDNGTFQQFHDKYVHLLDSRI